MQQLKPADNSQRLRYVEWVLEQQAVDDTFSKKVFFSVETHFTLGGYVNKHNCRIWNSELKRGYYIHKKSLFGALFGPKV